MTYPITPNPAIHNDTTATPSTAVVSTTQLQGMGQQLIKAFLNALWSLLTTGSITPPSGSNANNAPDLLKTLFADVFGPAGTLLAEFLETGNWSDLSAALTDIFGTASTANNNWTTLLESLGLSAQTVDALSNWLQTLLEPNSPLNASNLWGLLPSSVASNITSTAVNSTPVNQLWNPNFQNAISLQPNAGWSWDSTVYYGTGTGLGSAKVTANGTNFGLRSNPIPVQGGQSLAVSIRVLTSGLTATGSPLELDVVTYLGGTQVAVTTVQASGAPTGATTTWTGAPSGSVAGELSGTFPVPSSGVDSVLVRLAVDSTATAGTVWFGDGSAVLTGGLIATIQDDLTSLSDDFTAGNTAFATFLQSVLTDITDYSSWSTFIAAIESAWNTYTTTATGLASDEIFTIQQLINTLLGVNATTGQIAPASVANVLGGSSLGADLTSLATQLFGSATVNNITTIEQDIISFIGNAISGGNAATSTNSPAQAIYDALSYIPHTNVVIPPSPGSGSITHDAHASGTAYTGDTNYDEITWSHTCAAAADYMIMRVLVYSGTQSLVMAATYNGVALQPILTVVAPDNYTQLHILALPNPTTGSAETATLSVYSPFGNYIGAIAGETDSYIGVGSVGTTAVTTGSNSNPSHTVTSASGDYLVQAFALSSSYSGVTLSSYSQTSEYNSGSLAPLISIANSAVLLAGDGAGSSSVAFTATASNTTLNNWCSAAVNLIPQSSNVIGSGFRAANTSTSNVSAAAATTNELFPNSFFNSTSGQPIGADFVASGYSTTGNTVTVGHAGWYTVTIAVLISATVSNQYLGLLLYQTPSGGSAIIKRGNHQYIYNPLASANYVVSHTFQVYCNAGDTLQPGYYVSTTGNWFAGTADGLSTYFEVSLNNRSLM